MTKTESPESHEATQARAQAAGLGAAKFASLMGSDESPEQMAVRRKQDERNPSVWSDAFLLGYASYVHPLQEWSKP